MKTNAVEWLEDPKKGKNARGFLYEEYCKYYLKKYMNIETQYGKDLVSFDFREKFKYGDAATDLVSSDKKTSYQIKYSINNKLGEDFKKGVCQAAFSSRVHKTTRCVLIANCEFSEKDKVYAKEGEVDLITISFSIKEMVAHFGEEYVLNKFICRKKEKKIKKEKKKKTKGINLDAGNVPIFTIKNLKLLFVDMGKSNLERLIEDKVKKTIGHLGEDQVKIRVQLEKKRLRKVIRKLKP